MIRSEFIHLPAGRYHYLTWGTPCPSRPALVLLHANAGSAESWARVGAAMAGRFQVYALDMRGHGDSWRAPIGHYRLRAAADDVVAFLDLLGLRAPVLIGHSWGAAVALVTATGAESARQPPGLTALVLEDPPARMSPQRLDASLRNLLRAITLPPALLRETIRERHPHWDRRDVDSLIRGFEAADPGIVRSLVEDGASSDSLPALLARLEVHALVLRADPSLDGLLNENDWRAIQLQLPAGSAGRDFPGVSHHIHRDAFDAFLAEIHDFAAATPPEHIRSTS